MSAVGIESLPDLGAMRHLSDATLDLCNVRAVGHEHTYGAGWLWDTYTLEGVKATRWKSVSSERPPNDERWAKYRWYPKQPEGNAAYFDPDHQLRAAIKNAYGSLFLVGGEIAAMSMFDAGFRNTTCFFGDNAIPDKTFYNDLKRLGVGLLIMIPDRDEPGQACAVKVRDLLAHDLDFAFDCKALPYDVADKHGKDVNDWWIDLKGDREKLRDGLDTLPSWHLREPEPKIINLFPLEQKGKLPPGFVEAILHDVESRATPNKAFRWGGDGWSSNFRCPFHDDREASAGFNRESMSFKCFVCDSKSAKEYGEGVGISLKDYYDDAIPIVHTNGSAPTVNKPPPVVAKNEPPTLAPKLSVFARLAPEQEKEAVLGRKWLDEYLTWTKQSCPLAPEIFHEAMALWLLATVATRRMKLVIGGQEIYPNLYVLVIAKTSLYRKSTAMNEAKKVLKQAGLECLLLPTDVTPEALFDELAGVKPINFEHLNADDKKDWLQGRAVAAQRAFVKDECSSIFANLHKDYNAGLTELLLEGYQGDGGKLRKLLKSKGLISVRDMCLSFLGATTPVMYAKYITNEETENGFVARFAIITPEGMPTYEIVDEPIPIPPTIVTGLRRLFLDVLPWHNNQRPTASTELGEVLTPPATTVSMSADAVKQLNEYRKALNYDMLINDSVPENKAAAYTRLGTMVMKVAMLLAAADTDTAPIRIEARHAYAAQLICERWRESLHRLERDVAHSIESANEKVLNYLRSAGTAGATARDIMRDCAIKQKNSLQDVLNVLYDDGVIEKFEHKKSEGAGRPSIRFRMPQKDLN